MDGETEVTEQVIGAAIRVHQELGPGLLESAYKAGLAYELRDRGVRFEAETRLPVVYRGVLLDCDYRLDLIVEDSVVVELKSVKDFEPVHFAQLLTYLKLSRIHAGLLINFNVPVLSQGIRRVVHGSPA